MVSILIVIFSLTYLAIAFEHPLKVNKSASALLGAALLWAVYAGSSTDLERVNHELLETLANTAQIVFFLMGAMTIVEVIDAHDGFDLITSKIKTKRLLILLWIICSVAFFMSAILDNLTTTIVIISLVKKLLKDQQDRLIFAGMTVIAANAGGAWSPIGDVTTTMLWIGGQITASQIVKSLLLPSIANLMIPLCIISFALKGKTVYSPQLIPRPDGFSTAVQERNIMLFLGLGVLVSVPAFKTLTHLPPFMGVFLGLGLLWLVGDLLHKNKSLEERNHVDLTGALSRIDLASLIFFVGILLAVATLEHTGLLTALANSLEQFVGRQDLIVILIGLASAIVDNVPLVAASMGMYSLDIYPTDHFLWEFLAYCAGTGGSILIIGSAAGVAAMGLEKIEFGWYLRKISGLALLGYLGGALVYIAQF
jgi:Na+/H+ antiporter NhaD/arsenite permease-like protein